MTHQADRAWWVCCLSIAAMSDQRTANQIAAIRHALMGLIQAIAGLLTEKHPDKAAYLQRLWDGLRTLNVESK